MGKVDKVTELAQLFKARDNPSLYEITTATVISISPVVFKISDKVFLSKEYNNLVLSASIFKDYTRKIKIENLVSETDSVSDGGTGASSHKHNLVKLEGDLKYAEEGFKKGDEILVIPISNGEMWYAIDKVVRL